MELTFVCAIGGLEARGAGEVERYDSLSISGNSVGANLRYERCCAESVWRNVVSGEAMLEPCLHLFGNVQRERAGDRVAGCSPQNVKRERSVGQLCQGLQVVTHAPPCEHLREGICEILEDLAIQRRRLVAG